MIMHKIITVYCSWELNQTALLIKDHRLFLDLGSYSFGW